MNFEEERTCIKIEDSQSAHYALPYLSHLSNCIKQREVDDRYSFKMYGHAYNSIAVY